MVEQADLSQDCSLPIPVAACQEIAHDCHAALKDVLRQVGSEDGIGKRYFESVFGAACSSSPQEVRVSVCGGSGDGKSALINAMRNLPCDHKDAAPTDITECTIEPRLYRHPEQPNVVFQDNPGFDYVVKHFCKNERRQHKFDQPSVYWYPTCARCQRAGSNLFGSFNQCKCLLAVHAHECVLSEDHRFKKVQEAPCPEACCEADVRQTQALLQHVKLADFVLVVTSKRFKESSARYIELCKKLGKPFCLVYTQIDLDLQKQKPDTVRATCDRIRESMRVGSDGAVESERIFLVNSLGWDCERFEMANLQMHILKSMPRAQMLEFMRVVKNETAELIETKRAQFHASGFREKALAIIGSASPIPGSGLAADYYILHGWGYALTTSFGLDRESMNASLATLQSKGIDSLEVELVYNLATHGTIWGKFAALNGFSLAGLAALGPPGYIAGCAFDAVVGGCIIVRRCSTMVDEAAQLAHRVHRAIEAAIKRSRLGFHVVLADLETSIWWSVRADHEEGLVFASSRDPEITFQHLILRNVRSPVSGCFRLRAHVAMGTIGEDWYLSCCNKVVRLRPQSEIPDFALFSHQATDADFRPSFGVSGEGTLAFESAAHPGWFVACGSPDEPLELHQVTMLGDDGGAREPRPELQRVSWTIRDLDE